MSADREGEERRAERERHRWRVRRLAVVYFAVVALTAACAATGMLDRAELRSYDLRAGFAAAEGAEPGIVIVAIDERTIDGIDIRYPYPRAMHARAIRELAAAGPAAIAYDVVFTDPTTPRQDRLLAAALGDAAARAPVLIGVAKLYPRSGAPSLFLSPRRLAALGVELGVPTVTVDVDGSQRRIDYALEGYTSFGIRAAELVRGRELPVPEQGEPAWIEYRGPPGTFATVPFVDVVRGAADPARFRGKLVIVGGTDPSFSDLHPVPPDDALMAGVELQANVAATAGAGYPLRTAPAWTEPALVLALGLLAPSLALAVPTIGARRGRGRPRPLWGTYALAAGLWAVGVGWFLFGAQLLFDRGVVLAVTAPLLAGSLGLVGTLVADAGAMYRARRRIKNAFRCYVDPRVVEQTLLLADRAGRVEGWECGATALFCDLRSWTCYAERTDPEKAIESQHTFLDLVARIVADHGGAVFSFEGDGITAAFGALGGESDHADRALAAARALRTARWRLGVGVASGTVGVGTIGRGSRLAFTVSGMTVIKAARLEQETKSVERPVLLSASTYDLLSVESRAGLGKLPERLCLNGIAEPQEVWFDGTPGDWLAKQTILANAGEAWLEH